MTKLEALRALKEAVEIGKVSHAAVEELAIVAFGLGDTAINAGQAHGRRSVDAALALHKAVLPGWEWHLGPSNAKIYPYNGSPLKSWSGMATDPARAWLLAILAALSAQEEANG